MISSNLHHAVSVLLCYLKIARLPPAAIAIGIFYALYSIHWIPSILLYALYYMQCITPFYYRHWILCVVFCILYSIYFLNAFYSCQCILRFIIQCVVFCALYSIHYLVELHSMHYILSIVSYTFHKLYSMQFIKWNAYHTMYRM